MSELFDLSGQVAVITGSTKGIGLAIASRLAEHGAHVVISSRRQADCDAVAYMASGDIRPEEAVGRFCGDVLRPEGEEGARPCDEHCPILHARFRGATRATERLRLVDGDQRGDQRGTQRVVVITSAPPAEDQQFLMISDETETEAARRLRDAVLANISHEFKTPLAAQRASIELLREQILDAEDGAAGPEAKALVLSLERGGLRLTQLIDNLLESVRIEAGQTSLRSRPVALDEVVEEAVEMTGPLLAQRDQRLEVDLPYPLPEVEGDAPRLTQVFVNLLANANKFGPEGSTISVAARSVDGVIEASIDDAGPGVTENERGSIFERFHRASAEEPEPRGLGLGLWIVKSIVERHGGTVLTTRSTEGLTRFVVRLPAGSPVLP